MRRTNRTRLAVSLAVCLLAHGVLVVLLAREHPVLKSGPLGPTVLEVTMVPMFLPDPAASRKPRPVLRVRPPQIPAETPPLPPLMVPDMKPAPPAPPQGPPRLTPELGATLRRALGCANIASANLSQAERDACLAQLGSGAKAAPYIPSGLNRDKQELLDRAAEAKEAYRRYRDAPVPPGRSTKCDIGCAPHDLTGEGPPAPKHPF